MSKLKRYDFKPSDAEHIQIRNEDKISNTKSMIGLSKAGIAYSWFDGDDIVFCGGIANICKGVGEAWIVCSTGVEKYKIELVRECLKVFNEEIGYHRIQAHISNWDKSIKFVKIMGFKYESTLEKFGPDQGNFYMFVRV